MALFAFQARECAPYRDYLALVGIDPASVCRSEDIPFLPISFFRSHRVYCGAAEPELVFTSSGTGGSATSGSASGRNTMGGDTPSRHYMAFAEDYRAAFRRAFALFYPGRHSIYALLPGYLEREGSSLIYMVNDLIKSMGGGFYLDNAVQMLDDMRRDAGPKIVLGVSYALWDLAERFGGGRLDGTHSEGVLFDDRTVVMETGGMKGKREELPRAEFHKSLCKAFGVSEIASEYGMAELTSQAYSSGGGVFRTPPWMRVSVRDLADPFEMLGAGRSGGINIIDLANRFSCAFIQTDDLGRCAVDGSFEILGRIDKSVIRGCNLLVQ